MAYLTSWLLVLLNVVNRLWVDHRSLNAPNDLRSCSRRSWKPQGGGIFNAHIRTCWSTVPSHWFFNPSLVLLSPRRCSWLLFEYQGGWIFGLSNSSPNSHCFMLFLCSTCRKSISTWCHLENIRIEKDHLGSVRIQYEGKHFAVCNTTLVPPFQSHKDIF